MPPSIRHAPRGTPPWQRFRSFRLFPTFLGGTVARPAPRKSAGTTTARVRRVQRAVPSSNARASARIRTASRSARICGPDPWPSRTIFRASSEPRFRPFRSNPSAPNNAASARIWSAPGTSCGRPARSRQIVELRRRERRRPSVRVAAAAGRLESVAQRRGAAGVQERRAVADADEGRDLQEMRRCRRADVRVLVARELRTRVACRAAEGLRFEERLPPLRARGRGVRDRRVRPQRVLGQPCRGLRGLRRRRRNVLT